MESQEAFGLGILGIPQFISISMGNIMLIKPLDLLFCPKCSDKDMVCKCEINPKQVSTYPILFVVGRYRSPPYID